MNRIQTKPSGLRTRTEDLSDGRLALNVAFTSGPATVAALRRAAEMAQGLGAHLRVIVPQVVPYGRDLNDPDVGTSFTANRALEAAQNAGVEADVSVVLCRDRAEGLHSALGPDGIVLIGGVSRWWPFPERTLVRRLAALGHKVLFVEGTNN